MDTDRPLLDLEIDQHQLNLEKEQLTKIVDDHKNAIQSLLERADESISNGGPLLNLVMTTISDPKELLILSKVLAKVAQINKAMKDPKEKLNALNALETQKKWILSSILSVDSTTNELIEEIESVLSSQNNSGE